MTTILDLAKVLEGKSPVELTKTDVVRFKDGDANRGRVVAEAADFIVYSLKNPQSLRILSKQKADLQMTFKHHTGPVLSVQFCNYNSNIVASMSDREIIVWKCDAEGPAAAPLPYLLVDGAAKAFAWIFRDNKPELLFLQGDVVKSIPVQELITNVKDKFTGAAPVPVPAASIRSVAGGMAGDFLTARGKTFVAAMDPSTLVAGELGGRGLCPPWHPTESQPITFVGFIGTNCIAAANSTSVWVWNIADNPQLVAKVNLNGVSARLLALQSSTAGPNGTQCLAELYFDNSTAAFLNFDTQTVIYAKLSANVRPGCYCSTVTMDNVTLLTDFGSVVAYTYVLRDTPSTGFPRTVSSSTNGGINLSSAFGMGAGKMPPQVPGGKQIIGRPVQVPGLPPGAAGMPMTMPMPFAPPMYQFSPQQPQPMALRNPALAGVSGPRQMFEDAESARQMLKRSQDELEKAVSNLRSILSLSPIMMRNDTDKLVQRALDRQLREIRRQTSAPAAADGEESYTTTFADIQYLLTKVTSSLTVGVAAAVEQAVAKDIDGALVDAVSKIAKKDATVDLRAKLDQAIQAAAQEFTARVEEKIRQQTESQVLMYIRQVTMEHEKVVAELQSVIQQQSEMLAEYQRSNILSQLESLKKDVAKLKAAEGASGASSGPAVAPSPESIVTTARDFIQGKDFKKGLEWVTRYNNPELTLKLLTVLMGDATKSIVEDELLVSPAIDDATWGLIVGHLTLVQQSDALETALWWMDSILLEREGIMKSNLTLKETVRKFVTQWRTTPGISASIQSALNRVGVICK